MSVPRHFLDIDAVDAGTLRMVLARAAELKAGAVSTVLVGRALALLFEKPSTRTRVSFEVAAQQLGGHALVLNARDLQLGRGETIADTARVLSRYVHAIVLRTDAHSKLLELAAHASVPVINGLTDHSHPCQILADVFTFEERRGPVAGRRFAWVGDYNNVCRSLVQAAERLGFALAIATPPALVPTDDPTLVRASRPGGPVTLYDDPASAVRGADAVFTDTWVSMGDVDGERKRALLADYRVDARLMRLAAADALFLHCLPAHRGEEVTDEVIDGPQSVVFDEAENRLHVQKAILEWCLAA
jgi:ornithine carbamoyltransferase